MPQYTMNDCEKNDFLKPQIADCNWVAFGKFTDSKPVRAKRGNRFKNEYHLQPTDSFS